jgi:hypothetical protein
MFSLELIGQHQAATAKAFRVEIELKSRFTLSQLTEAAYIAQRSVDI